MSREGWVEIVPGVGVPREAVTDGPYLQRNHIDGPLLHWAGHMHWLTIRQRAALFFGLVTLDAIAVQQWPHLARIRRGLLSLPASQENRK